MVSSKPFVPTGRRERRRGDLGQRADRLQRVRVDAVREDVVRAVAEDLRGDGAAEERGEQKQDDEDAGHDGDAVLPEAQPDLLPVAARLDLARRSRRPPERAAAALHRASKASCWMLIESRRIADGSEAVTMLVRRPERRIG